MEYIRCCTDKRVDRHLRPLFARIRSNGHPTPSNSKKKNIDCVLIMRDQENTYDSESLYALFTDIDATRIKTIRDALRSEKWHFMKASDRLAFLAEYLPEEGFREYDDLISDFRMAVTVSSVISYAILTMKTGMQTKTNCTAKTTAKP
ncbi:MAG: hypothetical protein ACI3XF_04205 [Eubacteriales bacterium]